MSAEIMPRIQKTFSTVFGPRVPFRAELRRVDEPRWTSLKHVELIIALEQEFGALAIMLGRPPDLATGRRLARDAVASAGRVVVVVAGSVPDAHRRWWVSSDGWLHAEGNEFRLDFLDAGDRAGHALRSGRR